ncbi:MAG: hypothetical protein S4CHLAM6_00270 [Chlamydiae bacterium]|nr:hypothetical protein [Chlamydiota bacterium]
MQTQVFWNEVGSKKDFEDPLFYEKLKPYVCRSSKIMEYGCGYGRLLKILKDHGYENLSGYDFAPKMIARGKKANPDLDLNLVESSGETPLLDNECDLAIMSTILCCTVEWESQVKIVEEMRRILKPGGALYLADFLVSDQPRYKEKYEEGFEKFNQWGLYTTNEDITVRHHTTRWIMDLLKNFNIQWFEQIDFKTMNNNPARTFHCIATNMDK